MDEQRRSYDRGSTIFSPDGRLYQVEYAREAVSQGSTSVGVRTSEGVALAARRRMRSPLREPTSVEKLHALDAHVGAASAGHAADARRLVEFARTRAQQDRVRYGEPIGVDALTGAVTDHLQDYTQSGGTRPYGASLLIAGVDREGPRLFETDPSGARWEWRATAIGGGADAARAHLEAEHADDIGLAAGLDLALAALDAAAEEPLDPEGVALAAVDAADGTFARRPDGAVAERLDALDPGDAAA